MKVLKLLQAYCVLSNAFIALAM